jgi:hypothetical protein
MRLHESHEEGGFGVSHNTITRHAASYTTNAKFVAFLGTFARPAQRVWLPGNDIQDPTTWDAPPLCTLKRLRGDSCSSTTAPSKPHPNPRRRPALAAAQPPTRAHTRSLTQAPRTTATASSPTATRPPSFGIQAEAGVPLSVLQLSRPAGPAAPEVRHPYPAPCHGAAHQALGALQGPASAARRQGASRSSASFTCHRNTRPRSRTPPCAWRRTGSKSKPTTPSRELFWTFVSTTLGLQVLRPRLSHPSSTSDFRQQPTRARRVRIHLNRGGSDVSFLCRLRRRRVFASSLSAGPLGD